MKDKKQLEEEIYKMVANEVAKEPRKPVNKDAADCNEILLGYYCAGKDWSKYEDSKTVRKELRKFKKMLDHWKPGEYANQNGRAKEQAKAALEWAAANKFDGPVTRVYWTARPGALSKAVGYDVDSRKNPTDTLLRFGDDDFLGLSAKSTGQSSGDIGFKNPGLGKLADLSQRDLVKTAQDAMNSRSIKKLDFNDETGNAQRKAHLKKIGAYPLPAGSNTPTEVGMPYYKAGHKVLAAVRDELMDAYNNMSQYERKMHFIDEWLDAAGGLPYYIKVVGYGKKGRYTAKVVDPISDEKTLVLSSSDIHFEPTGTSSMFVTANGERLFKIRAKWESAPLASTIKFSGDPVTGW